MSSRQLPKPGSYTPRTPLEKHCAYFDRNKDGLLTPWETWEGFRSLGYGIVLTFIGTVAIHLFLSYSTLDTWIPDPFFTVHLRNIHRCKHGSDTSVYERDGSVKPERMDWMFANFAASSSGIVGQSSSSSILTSQKGSQKGLSLMDITRMIYSNRDLWDWSGWIGVMLEWGFLYALAGQDGVIPEEAIRGQYDGTLFYEIEARRRNNQNKMMQ